MTMFKKYLPLVIIGSVAVMIGMAAVVSLRTEGLNLPTSGSRPMPKLGTPMPLTELTLPGELPEVTSSGLPILSQGMPEFVGITQWLSSEPLHEAELRGKVVLIDFWTYSCINCIRTLPYITSWDEKYRDKGLVIVGVHTPEFDFEKKESNVRQALARHDIKYPVALDNDFATWNAYDNHYWPAKYLFDAKGRLRAFHFGEGEYAKTERDIQALLAEAGMEAELAVTEMPAVVDFKQVGTPETYLGYGRMEHLGSPEPVRRDAAQDYSVAAAPKLNEFYFGGQWQVGEERAEALASGSRIVYRYRASNVNLVMGANGGGAASVRAEVKLDGATVPMKFRGRDVFEQEGKTYVNVGEDRLYDLIDAKGDYGTHLFEIIFDGPGVKAYAFTFG